MSQPQPQPPYAAPADNAPPKFSQPTPQMSPAMPALQHPQRNSPHEAHHVPLSLPPLRQMSNTPPTPMSDRRPASLLGVHSILNPQADLADQDRNRRRSASQMDSPSPVEPHAPQNIPSISRPTSVDSTQGESMQRPFQPPGRPRHLLSPRSPTLHRTQSLSVLARPTGTIDAHASPFLSAGSGPRSMGPEPVTSQPALPTPPVANRAGGYFPAMPPSAPTPPPAMVRNDLRRPSSINFPQSGSASPNPNFSPYSQPSSVASSQFEHSHHHHHHQNHQSAYVPPTNNPPMQESHQLSMTMEAGRREPPIGVNNPQSNIQIMTIKSQQGHHVQIPVEVQAASKVADEKRKRNAGASARFRARRKEKEREASHSITRLETQLREAIEDIEYYRGERDYFKSIVFQQPGAERHYARPPSPRLRRISVAPSVAPSSTTGGGSADSPFSAYDEEPQEQDRNVRRRTSNYHPHPGSAPAPLNGSVSQPSTYPPSFAPAPVTSPSRPNFDSRDQQMSQQQQQQQHHQHHGDSFSQSGPGRYEGRNWQSPRDQR